MEVLDRVVGNRETITAQLFDQDGVVVNLTGLSMLFRLVNCADGTVKVDNAAATILEALTGKVGYAPAAIDVNTSGRYAIYWITNEVPARRFPYDGARYILNLKAENISD